VGKDQTVPTGQHDFFRPVQILRFVSHILAVPLLDWLGAAVLVEVKSKVNSGSSTFPFLPKNRSGRRYVSTCAPILANNTTEGRRKAGPGNSSNPSPLLRGDKA
jgi:hypothetical protein